VQTSTKAAELDIKFLQYRLSHSGKHSTKTFPESTCDVDQHQNYIFLLVIHLAPHKHFLRISRNLVKVLVTLIKKVVLSCTGI